MRHLTNLRCSYIILGGNKGSIIAFDKIGKSEFVPYAFMEFLRRSQDFWKLELKLDLNTA